MKNRSEKYEKYLSDTFDVHVKREMKILFPTKSISGGTNALDKDSIIKVIKFANIQQGDSVWEIGMGLPYLTLMLAYITKTTVVATDIGKIIE